MSRPLRIEYPGAWYHVMNHGRGGDSIFRTDNDYTTFIKVLKESTEAWNFKISAYCLMSNHYHLLVHTPDGDLSRCMRHINGIYTQRFNRYHMTDGQLFRGRYKAVLVDADCYLLEVLRYIHRNPLRAGLVTRLEDFTWSSHHGYISQAKKWKWLHKDFLLSMLAEKQYRQKKTYLEHVYLSEPEEIERFYALKKLPTLLGTDVFKAWVKETFSTLRFKEEVPQSRELAPSPEHIIALVCDYFKTEKTEMRQSRRGQENLPRDIAIYLVRCHTRDTLTEIGHHFGINKYSTVSSAVERVRARSRADKLLKENLKEIEGKL